MLSFGKTIKTTPNPPRLDILGSYLVWTRLTILIPLPLGLRFGNL